jgi:hypothetical protein
MTKCNAIKTVEFRSVSGYQERKRERPWLLRLGGLRSSFAVHAKVLRHQPKVEGVSKEGPDWDFQTEEVLGQTNETNLETHYEERNPSIEEDGCKYEDKWKDNSDTDEDLSDEDSEEQDDESEGTQPEEKPAEWLKFDPTRKSSTSDKQSFSWFDRPRPTS